MTELSDHTADTDINSILNKIGPIKFERPLSFTAPYENDDENKAWSRERAILLRRMFEHFPNHKAALSSLIQYSHLELTYPLLIAKAKNDLNTKAIRRLANLSRRRDLASREYASDWTEAMEPLHKLQETRAEKILMEHPDSGIAEWAHSHLIQQQGVRLLRSGEGNVNKTVRLVEELFTSVESYLN